MKKIVLLLVSFIVCSTLSYAQMSSKMIEQMAIEESEAMKKEGWKSNTGSMPLKYQLCKTFTMQEELHNGQNKYIISEGKVKGTTFEAARVHAMEMAKRNMVSLIDNMSLTESEASLVNVDGTEGAESENLQETKYKNTSSLQLGNFITVLSCYRETTDGKVEVLVKLACTRENIVKALLKRAKSDSKPQDSTPKVISSHTL